jgi:MFS family permease
LVIFATRTLLGEDAFLAWGWRIPFIASLALLIVSVWLRFKLSESPAFAKLKEEGEVCKTPLREAFGQRDNVKRVLIAFFGIMCAQGAVWYATFFYVQVFLGRSLAVPEPTVNMLLIVMTLVSAPLYVFFGWLSDRIGRKPVLVGGMVLALALYLPGFHWIASAANPALVEAQRATPVVVATDPASCAVQFDPVGTARFDTACDIAKSLLVTRGIAYSTMRSADGSTTVAVGDQRLPIPGGAAVPDAELKALKGTVGKQLAAALEAAGYPKAADAERINLPVLIGVLLLFVVAATALYGPQAAALVEMFPTRVRYTAMSLPYHVGTGWVGGFLPVTSFALAAITGNIYASLWYPIFFTALSVIVALLFLKETRGKPLDEV